MPDPCTRNELVSLREHFERLLQEHEKRDDLQHESDEKARAVLERQAEHWRQNANEWRAAMDDRERNFLPRSLGYVLALVSIVSLVIGIWGQVGK